MTKSPWLGRSWVVLALVLVPLSFISCGGDDNGDDGNNGPPASQPGTASPPVPSSRPSSKPSWSPTATPAPTCTTNPYPVPVPYPQPYPLPVPVPVPYPVPVPTHTHPYSDDPPLQQGQYGGQDISVNVASDHADFRFDCALGEVSQAIESDDQGNFDVNGTYEEREGPVPRGGFPSYSAHYVGQVSDDGHLHLEVTFVDDQGNEVDQSYDAVLGEQAVFTQVCALVTPSVSPAAQPSATPSPQPSAPPPSLPPAPQSLPGTMVVS